MYILIRNDCRDFLEFQTNECISDHRETINPIQGRGAAHFAPPHGKLSKISQEGLELQS